MNVIFCLGRYGDITSALPIAWHLAQAGERPRWFVSIEHQDILDGVSYVDREVWNGAYSNHQGAMAECRQRFPGAHIIDAQCFQNPDRQRRTASYQTESWRLAGMLDKFSQLRTEFDRRDPTREAELAKKLPAKPFVLIAANGISSPFHQGDKLIAALREQLKTHEIVDTRSLKAHRIYDMLGVMDRAALVISVDTVFLHLARACATPVVAIVNDGWSGSVPPPSAVATFRYADVHREGVQPLVDAVLTATGAPPKERRVFHVVDLHSHDARHVAAQNTWAPLYKELGVIPVLIPTSEHTRNAQQIGDPRSLPFLKDLLNAAVEKAEPQDIILWTNDDVALDARVVAWAKEHVGKHGAASMRRVDLENPTGIHMGRDLFAFTKRWLVDHWHQIPDFYLGAPMFDLVLAAMLRKQYGINSTLANLHEDFPPADATDRYVRHEAHTSSWAGAHELTSPANQHNQRLASAWCRANCPSLAL